jgi:Ca2+-transporting ATPase
LGIINPHYFESINSDYLKDVSNQKLSKMLENKEKDYVFSELIPSDRDRIIDTLRYSGQNIIIIRPDLKMTFQKITQAMIKGRTDKENEPKLILHSFSCKIAELFIIIMTILLRTPIPFSITLILFIEIFINLPLELAIKTSKPEIDITDKNYTNPVIHIPFKQLLSNGIIIGTIICGIYLFNILRYGWVMGDVTPLSEEAALKSTTIAFVLLVISQIFNAFNVKNLDTSIFKIKTFTNRYLIATTVIVILLTYIFINFFILGNYLDIGIISSIEWQIILFATVVLVLAEELKKFIIQKFTKNANSNSKK